MDDKKDEKGKMLKKKRKKEKFQRVLNVACGELDRTDKYQHLNQMYMVNNTEGNNEIAS